MTNRQTQFLKSILTEEQNRQLSAYIQENPTTLNDLNETALNALYYAINTCGFNFQNFAKATTKWHRYLQNELFKLAMAIIQVYGSEDYQYDGRNEYAHNQSQLIIRTI